MLNEKVTAGLKLSLRFAVMCAAAVIIQRYLVIAVECAIHVWETYPKECLNVVFAVALACMDLIDGAFFGRSVIDTVFDKLKGK